MGRGGFEPPKQVAADLQSVPFGHSGICPLLQNYVLRKRVMGIEPTYPAWKAGVLPLNYTRRCPVPESNQRHKDFQSFALPTELTGQVARDKAYCIGNARHCQANFLYFLYILSISLTTLLCYPFYIVVIFIQAERP